MTSRILKGLALLAVTATLSGCAVYPAGYGYRQGSGYGHGYGGPSRYAYSGGYYGGGYGRGHYNRGYYGGGYGRGWR